MAGVVLAARAAGSPLGVLVAIAPVAYAAALVGLRAISVAEVRDLLSRRPGPA
jgi:hypothetical protein